MVCVRASRMPSRFACCSISPGLGFFLEDSCDSASRSFICSSTDLLSQPRATQQVYRQYNNAMNGKWNRDHVLVAVVAAIISVNAFLYFLSRDQTYVHIDAIAHVNKARGLTDYFQPGLRNLGTVWLPLPHLLIAPLAAVDPLWKSGAAGSLISVLCFIGTSLFLFAIGTAWTGSRIAGWVAFLLFAVNPRLIYFFTTPENETLTIFCASGLIYFLVRWSQHERWRDLALAGVFALAGTWTRYESWALAAVLCVVVSIVTRQRRIAATILFTGATVLGPMLWMLFNLVYFDDPLMFAYGIG